MTLNLRAGGILLGAWATHYLRHNAHSSVTLVLTIALTLVCTSSAFTARDCTRVLCIAYTGSPTDGTTESQLQAT